MLAELHWIAIVSPASWHRLTADGLTYTHLSARYARQADALRAGDRIAFYVTARSTFAAIAHGTGRRIAKTTMWPQGVYPYRVPLAPDHVLTAQQEVSVKPLLSRLAFVNNKNHWEMYFCGTIRLMDSKNFAVISRALAKASVAAPSLTQTHS